VSILPSSRVLITGAGGFIGSHTTELLVSSGFEVSALCHYNNVQSTGWLDSSSTNNNFHIVFSDITDSGRMDELISEHDLVIHFAAMIAIPYSYVAPRSYLSTNIEGTFNILEAVRRHKKRLINISTSEVYGTPKVLPITEMNTIQPQSPYAASKVAADALCNSFIDSYDLDISIIRPFNTYGPRQSQRALIPTILTQLAGGNKLISLGNLDTQRDFTYVGDTALAIKLAVESQEIRGKTIHLGTGLTISVQDLVGLIGKVVGTEIEIKVDHLRQRPPASEVEILQSDPSYAKKILGWEYKVSLEEGIKQTYQWIQNNPQKYSDPRKYVI
jgi:UDP-glucose 4-epimerase